MAFVLGDLSGTDLAPKLAALSRLCRAGLPVPPGLGLEPDELPGPEVRARLARLLTGGPVIVRAALADEDRPDASAAGLGRSIADCHDLAAIDRAAAEIAAASRDPQLQHYSRGPVRYQLLVQRQVARRWLAVVAADRDGARMLELHDDAVPDALALGATPRYAGPLALADPALAAPIAAVFDHVLAAMPEQTALDLELILDPEGAAWLVQARPLARPLSPGWPAFRDAVAPGCAHIPDLPGLWCLDAEHNPAALSPAHAGVITWLIGQGADLRILGGWLYQPAASRPTPDPRDPREVLQALRQQHLPAARRVLAAIERDLAGDLPACLTRALEQLRRVLALHAELRVALPGALPAPGPGLPLSLRDRDAHLDVLPTTWDIASPALIDLPALPALWAAANATAPDPLASALATTAANATTTEPLASALATAAANATAEPRASALAAAANATPEPLADPDDPDVAAVLVRELDDHLFALGLAPLRRVYLAAGARLGLGDDVFLFTPDELARALAHPANFLKSSLELIDGRREAQRRRCELRPPLALYDGRPVPLSPRRRLFGLPFGPPVSGPIAQRRDLHDLLTRPPAAHAIVVMPALTAQAAVALRMLSVRAVCCEHGGALSHAALMVRELGLSALIGCAGCSELADGLEVELDTRLGRLRPC